MRLRADHTLVNAILSAARNRDETAIKRWISEADQITMEDVLRMACRGDLEALKTLVACGLRVDNVAFEDGVSPLMMACDRPDIVAFLLRHDADVNHVDRFKDNALAWACHGLSDDTKTLSVIDMLIDAHIDIDACDALRIAVMDKRPRIVRRLLRAGASIRLHSQGVNLLMDMFAHDHEWPFDRDISIKIARMLISTGHIRLNEKAPLVDPDTGFPADEKAFELNGRSTEGLSVFAGYNELIMAVQYRDEALLALLIRCGADIYHRADNGDVFDIWRGRGYDEILAFLRRFETKKVVEFTRVTSR